MCNTYVREGVYNKISDLLVCCICCVCTAFVQRWPHDHAGSWRCFLTHLCSYIQKNAGLVTIQAGAFSGCKVTNDL